MANPASSNRTASALSLSPGEAEVSADLLQMGIDAYKEQNGGATSGLPKSVAAIGGRTVLTLAAIAGNGPALNGGPQ